MEQRATVVLHSATPQVKCISVRHGWLAEYIGKERRKIYDCFIAGARNDYHK